MNVDLKPRKGVATFRAAREQQNKGAISAPSRKHRKLPVARRNQALNIASRTMPRLWNQLNIASRTMSDHGTSNDDHGLDEPTAIVRQCIRPGYKKIVEE